MPKLGLVYDLRMPGMPARERAGQYRTCLEQAAWADRVGIGRVSLREHHSSPDGYLPSPVTLAAGVAAVTSSLTILLQALVVTLYDPVRVAEDLSVLDLMSAGRLAVMAGAGYDAREHAMFGRDFAQRPRQMEQAIGVLRRAWTGEAFEFDGRPVRVTPLPFQPSGPPLLLGGASRAAARRAAAIADGYLPIRDQGYQDYRDAVIALGRPDPGPLGKSAPFFVWVADDPERAWHEIGPYCLHETNAYGALAQAAGLNTGFVPYDDLDALRCSGEYPILTPQECVSLCDSLGDDGKLTIAPLVGGMHPDLSWQCLELIEAKVLPHVRSRPSLPGDYRVSVPETRHIPEIPEPAKGGV
jgi:alkanesulfonate monooxygenase SsuD/methylene tetrahydromethanopterin reductase-like flavin-dependent oxidoreductase (luciferase family)